MSQPTIFIHTNRKQIVGALVSGYAFRRNSHHADKFDVRIIEAEEFPFLRAREGSEYLRDGVARRWRMDDLQSFTPLRFKPPELLGYVGRALVVDPDVFATGDVWELLSCDMQGAAILCRPRRDAKWGRGFHSSVMLLDCARLTHWQCERHFQELFEFKRDYLDWLRLQLEPSSNIGALEDEWNDLDRLSPETKLLHTTRRRTQPWKTGLPIDFQPPDKPLGSSLLGWLNRVRRDLFGEYALLGRYARHPDANQERFFFGLLRECLDRGIVAENMLRSEMLLQHVRPDLFDILDRTPVLAM
jgi:hypothetical protein